MIEMLMSLALAFGITFYAIPVIIHVSNEKRLFDIPDDRKLHRIPIPSIGGLGIFAGFLTAFLLTVTFKGGFANFQYLVAALMVMFFVGMKDDLMNIPPFKKFLGQILSSAILIFKGGFVITDMHGILGIHALPTVAAYAVTFITIVVIINAFNLIDGVDGLAASLSLLSCIVFATFFAINNQMAFACIATSMAGALAAFLIFNFNPARIFMGDTGSLVLGLLHAVMVIQFMHVAPISPVIQIEAAPAVGFAILFVPLFDTLRVFSMRILHGESPFTPDRNHIHHILLRLGMSHTSVVFSLLIANLAILGLALGLKDLGCNWVLAGILALGFITVSILGSIYGRRRLKMVDGAIHGKKSKGKIRFISYITKEAANQN